MTLEYGTMNLYPGGHIMERLRSYLPDEVLTSAQVASKKEGAWVKVAGVVARPLQHPLSTAYFMTLEDEHGQIPLAIWPNVYERFKGAQAEMDSLSEQLGEKRSLLARVLGRRGGVEGGGPRPVSPYMPGCPPRIRPRTPRPS